MRAIKFRKKFLYEELRNRGKRLKVMGRVRLDAIAEIDNLQSSCIPWGDHGRNPYKVPGRVAAVAHYCGVEVKDYGISRPTIEENVCW